MISSWSHIEQIEVINKIITVASSWLFILLHLWCTVTQTSNNNQSVICVNSTLWRRVGRYVEALVMCRYNCISCFQGTAKSDFFAELACMLWREFVEMSCNVHVDVSASRASIWRACVNILISVYQNLVSQVWLYWNLLRGYEVLSNSEKRKIQNLYSVIHVLQWILTSFRTFTYT